MKIDYKYITKYYLNILNFLATIFGQYAVVKKFLELGIDKNAADLQGETCLHYASKCGFPLIIKLLLDHGANPTIKNGTGASPKDLAAYPSIISQFM